MPESTKTYEVVTPEGVFQIDVPAEARVSYGPVIGANQKSSFGGNALRIWEGKTKATEVQRALFQNVTSFRDLSIPMRVRACRLFGSPEDAWFRDDGSWTGKRAELVQKGWQDAAALTDIPVVLAEDEEDFTHLHGTKPRRNRAFVISEGES